MALEIINNRIVGTIDNLEEKLDGKLPVTREDLIVLINSWGRRFDFYTKASNDQTLIIDICESKECYDLSKLDVSQITNMGNLFTFSLFDGDVSKWNTSNVTSMVWMFTYAKSFNQALNFDTSKVTNMDYMFDKALTFENKYNSGRSLPNYTNEIKEWLNDNRDRMSDLNIKDKYGNQIDDFFSKISNKEFSKEI